MIKSFEELPVTLRVEQVQEILGISRAMAYKLAKQKGFPAVRINKRIVIPRDRFMDWLEKEAEKSG